MKFCLIIIPPTFTLRIKKIHLRNPLFLLVVSLPVSPEPVLLKLVLVIVLLLWLLLLSLAKLYEADHHITGPTHLISAQVNHLINVTSGLLNVLIPWRWSVWCVDVTAEHTCTVYSTVLANR